MRYEDVIGQFAGRQAGSPTTPATPGAPPTASQPPGSPNPPGLNSAMPGRKPDNPPAFGGMPGMPLPQQAEVSPPQGKESTPAQASNLEQQKNTEPAAQVLLLNRIPQPGEMYGLPPGVTIRTPYGDLDQEGNIVKSPEYEQKHKEAIVRAKSKFGPHPWNGMVGAPEPMLEVGKSHFNPFTRGFGRVE